MQTSQVDGFIGNTFGGVAGAPGSTTSVASGECHDTRNDMRVTVVATNGCLCLFFITVSCEDLLLTLNRTMFAK